MGYWKHNVEKMDEIIMNNLPKEWRDKVESGEIDLLDVPVDIQCDAMRKGEPDYWAGLIDDAHERYRDRQIARDALED